MFAQLQQFESTNRILAKQPEGARRLFWTTRKWSLDGATPLAALVIGRFEEILVAAAGFTERSRGAQVKQVCGLLVARFVTPAFSHDFCIATTLRDLRSCTRPGALEGRAVANFKVTAG